MTTSQRNADSEAPVIVVGGGGFAREVIWLARESIRPRSVLGVLDDNPAMAGQHLCGVPVLGLVDKASAFGNAEFVVAVGSPRVRKSLVARLAAARVRFATLIHRSAKHSAFVTFGEGTLVTADCILTTQIVIGNHVILNLATTIGHDCRISDFCTLAPRATISGAVVMEPGVEIGTGATLIQNLSLAQGCMVGAGAVVTKPVEQNALVVGVPAHPIKVLPAF